MGLAASTQTAFPYTEESVEDDFLLVSKNPYAIVSYEKPTASGQLVSAATQNDIKHFLKCSGVVLGNVVICSVTLAAAGGFIVGGFLLIPNLTGPSAAIFLARPELFALVSAPTALSMTAGLKCIEGACSDIYLSYPTKPQLALEYKVK